MLKVICEYFYSAVSRSEKKQSGIELAIRVSSKEARLLKVICEYFYSAVNRSEKKQSKIELALRVSSKEAVQLTLWLLEVYVTLQLNWL